MPAETPVTQRSPCYSAVSSSLVDPLPDCSNWHFATPTTLLSSQINASLVSSGQTLYQAYPLENIYFTLLQRFTAESSRELSLRRYRSALRKLNNKQRQVVMFLLFKLSSQLPFASFSFLSILSLLPFSILSLLPFLTSPMSIFLPVLIDQWNQFAVK